MTAIALHYITTVLSASTLIAVAALIYRAGVLVKTLESHDERIERVEDSVERHDRQIGRLQGAAGYIDGNGDG